MAHEKTISPVRGRKNDLSTNCVYLPKFNFYTILYEKYLVGNSFYVFVCPYIMSAKP